ncbi:hypothetical protein PUNSTDRAFT_128523 [Punctularia strigosozonata HHB-11173 SS5]|uniref:Uncharacterized protein n=1 Tax=Punctularia strigosozonata (strain HHB-11173) TaxID=741275 RepID=R7S156_PUNST|nr:uncharacterized protein PUNSTDRAFT_128523 [Punctularia strigosozonata HHB-11173 SS5]EIN03953.1 hypothetical protein PUNSTDRAFT_128523 [Punctularia strigosozonata HHB-11173 SS5]
MSTISVDSVAPVIPERRPHSALEVIDVDNLDDDVLLMESRRPLQRRRLDSHPSLDAGVIRLDDDDVVEVPVASGSGSGRDAPRRTGGNRLASLPPPLPRVDPIPAVPAVPRHLRSQQGMPLRRQTFRRPVGNTIPQGVVRANAQPFAFEQDMGRGPRRAPTPPPAPAPPSHHQPAMGLGGALLALNRQNSEEYHVERPQPPTRPRHGFQLPSFGQVTGALASTVRHIMDIPAGLGLGIFPHSPPAIQDEDPYQGYRDHLATRYARRPWHDDFDDLNFWLPDDIEIERHHWPLRDGRFPIYVNRDRRKDPDYKQQYTHGEGKPPPGFSFDFAPLPPDPGPTFIDLVTPVQGSSSKVQEVSNEETLLVCAKCLDPLTVGGDADADGTERARRRIWALRCGHMIDGKCLETLMKPRIPDPNSTAPSASHKKGKWRAVETVPPIDDVAKVAKGKGKGKEPMRRTGNITAPDLDAEVHIPHDDEKARLPAHSDPALTAASSSAVASASAPEPPSIRSRLRPRSSWGAWMPGPSSSSSSLNLYSPPASHPPPPASSTNREMKPLPKRRNRRKVETFTWECPVAGCARQHMSKGRGGNWEVDLKNGPIALYL